MSENEKVMLEIYYENCLNSLYHFKIITRAEYRKAEKRLLKWFLKPEELLGGDNE